MNNRARGDYFERAARKDLEAHGWVVFRSGGSLGPADLVALHHERPPLLINCKLNGTITPNESDRTFVAAVRAGALPVLAWRDVPAHVSYRVIAKPRTYRGRLWLDNYVRRHRDEILPNNPAVDIRTVMDGS